MTNQAPPNLAAAIKARRAELAEIPEAAKVAWWQLQAALAARRAEQVSRAFGPTVPFVHSPVVDMAAVHARHAKVQAENAAWMKERGLS